jgi:DNA-binding response OmpR family regulator
VHGPVRLDPVRGIARSGHRIVTLTARERSVLELFLRTPGTTLTVDAIAAAAWPGATRPQRATVVTCVGSLRRKLEAGGEPRLLKTVRGVGYLLCDPAAPGHEAPHAPTGVAGR